MFKDHEVIAEKMSEKCVGQKKRRKRKEKKGKNNFRNRCIAIVLLPYRAA